MPTTSIGMPNKMPIPKLHTPNPCQRYNVTHSNPTMVQPIASRSSNWELSDCSEEDGIIIVL